MKYLLWLMAALPLCAQTTPPRQLLPQVREYLELTNVQVFAIALNSDEYNRGIQERIQRVRQVQMEIAAETAKDPLDSAALGVRYTEIELICRDLREIANTLRKQNLALLTDAQLVKLKLLEEAMKLLPVATEAQMSNLLGSWATAPGSMNVTANIVNVPIPGVNAVNGCSGTGILTGAIMKQ
ncbi:MAG TPA: hypothetical protein VGK29_10380 [Paludibaculum sp.]|jgi:hypothetical protein